MPANTTELEKRLWSAADELRANSKLKSSEYSVPVLGLIFLRYADHKFAKAKAKLTSQGSGRRSIGRADYQAKVFSTCLKAPDSRTCCNCRKVSTSVRPSTMRCGPSKP